MRRGFFFPVPHTPSLRVGLGFAVVAPCLQAGILGLSIRQKKKTRHSERFSDSQSRRAHTRAKRNYQGKNFFNPFFLLL
ncbi:MAG TPA: hypothetical protein VK703_10050, partial [Candidatus Acidoferrales bacterium]|nr:hypothetical protein [Candidatus Acidoferrales bacterium]